jgi:hypothetical protein
MRKRKFTSGNFDIRHCLAFVTAKAFAFGIND